MDYFKKTLKALFSVLYLNKGQQLERNHWENELTTRTHQLKVFLVTVVLLVFLGLYADWDRCQIHSVKLLPGRENPTQDCLQV